MTTHTPDPIPPASGDLSPLMREPFAAITSLDGTVKEPLICLSVPERDAILAALRPAVVGEAVAWRYRRKEGLRGERWTVCEREPHIRDTHDVQPLYTTPASHDALIARVRETVDGLMDCVVDAAQNGSFDTFKFAAARALLADLDAGAGR